jgi:hypothetical protein
MPTQLDRYTPGDGMVHRSWAVGANLRRRLSRNTGSTCGDSVSRTLSAKASWAKSTFSEDSSRNARNCRCPAQVSGGVSNRVADVEHAVVESSVVQQLEVES